MDRRRFLRELGLGSVGAASFTALAHMLAVPASAGARRNFHMLAVSAAGPEGGPRVPRNQIFMSGDGAFDPDQREARGGGFYVHFLFPGRVPLPGEVALPIIASGTWKARHVVKYEEFGLWGVEAGASLVMTIDLWRQIPSKAVIRDARLEIISIPPFAGLATSNSRVGYTLTIPGTEFAQGGLVGPFAPLDPPIGVAAFSIVPLS